MGTRNLTCVVQDKKLVVAQYGQWDGNPGGQGKTIVEFLRGAYHAEKFAAQVRAAVPYTKAEEDKLWKKAGAANGGISPAKAEEFAKTHPELSRDTAADILEWIQIVDKPRLHLEPEFSGDSLFCEWGYVVDLDRQVFEVYKGFNKRKLAKSARFAEFDQGGDYHPIRLVKSFPLADIIGSTGDDWMAGLKDD